jgi:hypothetical protein
MGPAQLSYQRYDNLLAIERPFSSEDFDNDPIAYAPIKQGQIRIDRRRNSLA